MFSNKSITKSAIGLLAVFLHESEYLEVGSVGKKVEKVQTFNAESFFEKSFQVSD